MPGYVDAFVIAGWYLFISSCFHDEKDTIISKSYKHGELDILNKQTNINLLL